MQRLVDALHDGQRMHPSQRHKPKREDTSRRPTFAMDHYIMNMKSVVDAQTVSEEAATCIAVKEDRHQNIIRSVALENR